jgi:hypothetical protein
MRLTMIIVLLAVTACHPARFGYVNRPGDDAVSQPVGPTTGPSPSPTPTPCTGTCGIPVKDRSEDREDRGDSKSEENSKLKSENEGLKCLIKILRHED